jgi:hypothetical protein
VIYPIILAALLVALGLVGRNRTTAEVTLLRGIGAPYAEHGAQVENHLRVKIRNRTESAQAYSITLLDEKGATLIAPENPLHVAAGQQETESVFVMADRNRFARGAYDVKFRISDGSRFSREVPYRLLGPKGL